MKKMLFKAAALVLSLVMMLTMLSACGGSADADLDEIVDAAVNAALDASAKSAVVTIAADGRQITIEDTHGKSIQQLLDQAGITLNSGDVLSITPDQTLSGYVTIQVLRKCAVTVLDSQTGVQYTAVLVGGTVSDAIAAVGMSVDGLMANYTLDSALEDGMQIIVSAVGVQQPEETQPVETDTEEEPDNSADNNSNNNSNTNPGTNTTPDSGNNNDSGNNSDNDTGTENERTIVSIQIYEDCDGSGHGVKVITYSDGTQEEVPF